MSSLRKHFNKAEPSNLFFWRDSHKNEIDFLLDRGLSRLAIEVKSGQTLNPSFLVGLDYWKRLDPGRNDGTLLIYSGDGVINQYRGHAIANWRNPEKALEAWPDEDEGKPSGDDWPPGGRPYF